MSKKLAQQNEVWHGFNWERRHERDGQDLGFPYVFLHWWAPNDLDKKFNKPISRAYGKIHSGFAR